jgi:hypothetical protein
MRGPVGSAEALRSFVPEQNHRPTPIIEPRLPAPSLTALQAPNPFSFPLARYSDA